MKINTRCNPGDRFRIKCNPDVVYEVSYIEIIINSAYFRNERYFCHIIKKDGKRIMNAAQFLAKDFESAIEFIEDKS